MGVKENRDVVSKIIAALNETQAYQESVIRDQVDDWLDDHPEATTSVEDGAISYAKLDSSLQGSITDVGTIKDGITAMLTTEIVLPSSLFIYQRNLNSSGSGVTDETAATTSINVTIRDYCRVKADAGYRFKVMPRGTTTPSDWKTDEVFSALDGVIVVASSDSSDMTVSTLNKVHLYSTVYGEATFKEEYYINVEHTRKFAVHGQDHIYRYQIGTSTDDLGMLISNQTSKRATSTPHYSEKDIDLYCGQFNTNKVTIIYGGEVKAVLGNGERFHIPANTPFICGFENSGGTSSNEYETVNIMVVEDDKEPTIIRQAVNTTVNLTRADASFIADNGKMFFITYTDDGKYSVTNGTTVLVNMEELSHSPGHANSCNYDNGYVYVSDWTDPGNIVVYSVDETNNTLTYYKEIEIPIDAARGSAEYYVTDNENQIFFVGWKTGNSLTDPNVLVYGLYIKTTSGYTLAWEKFAERLTILQGFTVQDNYMYLVENTADYKFTGVKRINMATGLLETSAGEIVGGMASAEIEQAIAIGKQVFLITDSHGKQYIFTFVEG